MIDMQMVSIGAVAIPDTCPLLYGGEGIPTVRDWRMSLILTMEKQGLRWFGVSS
ncbi:MAG: hypothetical protein WCL39_06605 [Armatimonadota bacterium]